MRVKGTETSPPLLLAAGTVLLGVNIACWFFDVCDTALRRAWHALRSAIPGLARPGRPERPARAFEDVAAGPSGIADPAMRMSETDDSARAADPRVLQPPSGKVPR